MDSGPTGRSSLRRFNRTIQISLGAKTHLSLNHAIVRIENVADTASAADGVACDEMFDVTHRSSFNCKFGTPIQAMTAALQCFDFAGWDCKYADRKRVVLGKGVSVRVDLGGRRFINKKNKK